MVAVICGAEAALGLKALAGAAQGLEAADGGGQGEVGAFYWTVPVPDIVNLGREEQGLVSV